MEALFIALAFALGVSLGIWLESYRWRENAESARRIESFGKRYKVWRLP